MSRQVVLACSKCGSRNYRKTGSKNDNSSRIRLKKYCPICGEHTNHRQT